MQRPTDAELERMFRDRPPDGAASRNGITISEQCLALAKTLGTLMPPGDDLAFCLQLLRTLRLRAVHSIA